MAAARRPPDSYAAYDPILAKRSLPDCPWATPGGARVYVPLWDLLTELLAEPIKSGHASNTGRFPKAIDAWCAHELRRAGFDADEVWPRAEPPRILPREIAEMLGRLKAPLAQELRKSLLQQDLAGIAPVEASILGGVYQKQTDVVIAQWSRGAELVISTKSQLSSFGNNLKNRFEESYGDAYNIKQRFPRACVGFLYFIRSTAPLKKLEFVRDMLRRLQGPNLYDHTALVVGEWDSTTFAGVKLRTDLVPADLTADRFLGGMIECVLARTPASFHIPVRNCYTGTRSALKEGELMGPQGPSE